MQKRDVFYSRGLPQIHSQQPSSPFPHGLRSPYFPHSSTYVLPDRHPIPVYPVSPLSTKYLPCSNYPPFLRLTTLFYYSPCSPPSTLPCSLAALPSVTSFPWTIRIQIKSDFTSLSFYRGGSFVLVWVAPLWYSRLRTNCHQATLHCPPQFPRMDYLIFPIT